MSQSHPRSNATTHTARDQLAQKASLRVLNTSPLSITSSSPSPRPRGAGRGSRHIQPWATTRVFKHRMYKHAEYIIFL